MRVPDAVLSTTVFLCKKTKKGAHECCGTAFVASVKEPEGSQHLYLVTAKHVLPQVQREETIDGRKEKVVHVRVNMIGGSAEYRTIVGEWSVSDDPGVDLAAIAYDWSLTQPTAILPIGTPMFLTDQIVAETAIGIGDDVFATGLFTSVVGEQHNQPIVRFGNIASMPDQPIIEHDLDTQESIPPYSVYLVEMRSTGGLSGSPVFVTLGYSRDASGKPAGINLWYLLGVIRGHWPTEGTRGASFLADDFGQVQRGIATVTPIQYLTALLHAEPLASARRKMVEDFFGSP
jgi:hypothetical protein